MPPFRFLTASFAALAVFALVEGADADPFADVVISTPPTQQGDIFSPGAVTVEFLNEDMPSGRGYVEEEYFVDGTTDVYRYGYTPEPGELIMRDDVATDYRTRFIIRRPEKRSDFKGVVVVEWWNSSAGFDTAPAWDASAVHFARRGWIYVGISNATQVFGFLNRGCSIFPPITPIRCGTRYVGLSLPEDGIAYEMVSQIVNLLRGNEPQNPLRHHTIRRVFHVGQSQQAGSVNTYAREFHEPSLSDGYFIQAGGGGGRPLSTGSPNFGFADPRGLTPTNMKVPVIRAQTETEVAIFGVPFNRQDDTPTFRYYEIAGAAHLTVHKDIEIIPSGIFGPEAISLEDLCLEEMNTIVDGPVFGKYIYNAMWDNLDRQSRRHRQQMPRADWIELTLTSEIVRDADENAVGGIRLPDMNVPLGSHFWPANVAKAECTFPPFPPDCNPIGGLGDLACRLAGSTVPFDQATLWERYQRKWNYVYLVWKDSRRLWREGFLTREDRTEIVLRAVEEALGWKPPE